MLDALPDPSWAVACAVTVALFEDEVASASATEATRGIGTLDCWADAARFGVAHPRLGQAARTCFEAALGALDRLGVDVHTRTAAATFYDEYVAQGRCPADDYTGAPAWA